MSISSPTKLIRFYTALYADDPVALHAWSDGWEADVDGRYVDGAWRFDLAGDKCKGAFWFAFLLRDHGRATSPDIAAPAGYAELSYTEREILFAFVVRLQLGDYGSLDCSYAVRNEIDGWGIDLPGAVSEGVAEWCLEWGSYRDGFAFKFLLAGPESPEDARGRCLALERELLLSEGPDRCRALEQIAIDPAEHPGHPVVELGVDELRLQERRGSTLMTDRGHASASPPATLTGPDVVRLRATCDRSTRVGRSPASSPSVITHSQLSGDHALKT